MKRKLISVALTALFVCMGASAQIFYKIEGNGLKAPSYIFGTHHLAPLSVIDSIPGCKDAFAGVEQIVGEIDMTIDQMQLAQKMQPYMLAPQDSTLSKVIPAGDFARLNEEFKKWAPMPGMSLEMFDMLKPMVVTAFFEPSGPLCHYFKMDGLRFHSGITFHTAQSVELSVSKIY